MPIGGALETVSLCLILETNRNPVESSYFFQDFVLQELRKRPLIGMWWVGLSNKPRKDTKDFKWTDGKPLDTRVL